MEMRAIMALLLPCPPIPVMALMEGLGQMVQSSSHDIYGILMDVAARRNDEADNRQREQDQTTHANQLLANMRTIFHKNAAKGDAIDYEAVGAELYYEMNVYTVAYMKSYMPRANRISIACPPMDSISDAVRARVREWLAGREIVQGKNPNATAADHGWKSMPRLYYECAALVLEFEDKARIEELLVANEGKIKEVHRDGRVAVGGEEEQEEEEGREGEVGISKSLLGLAAVKIGEDDPAHMK